MSDSNEMGHMEFVKAMFFSADEAVAATPAEPIAVKRKSGKASAEIKALRAIVRGFNVLEQLGENQTAAALNYVKDRYGKWLNPKVLR